MSETVDNRPTISKFTIALYYFCLLHDADSRQLLLVFFLVTLNCPSSSYFL